MNSANVNFVTGIIVNNVKDVSVLSSKEHAFTLNGVNMIPFNQRIPLISKQSNGCIEVVTVVKLEITADFTTVVFKRLNSTDSEKDIFTRLYQSYKGANASNSNDDSVPGFIPAFMGTSSETSDTKSSKKDFNTGPRGFNR